MASFFCPLCARTVMHNSRGSAFFQCLNCEKKWVIVELPPNVVGMMHVELDQLAEYPVAVQEAVIHDALRLGKELP